ncbi:MAG: Yop proteins translocation protein U [Chlamydiales bacterium]|nr:Yop proteins translocation protein U [Chlamydiales bacterium]MCH9620206.1 Yop proteins translocation protein U [Chlamydiales bacterium]MCH9623079.1 Yop proteins translocation protein U [Chlamydiales bacterium]
MSEKTEKATPKKLKDARKKGQVAKSQDFPSALTFITGLAITLALAGYLKNQLGGFLLQVFTVAPSIDVAETGGYFINQMLWVILRASLPIAVAVMIVGGIVTFLTVGPTFAVEVFKPDIKKFNIVQNLKQKFKMKTFIELVKSVLKIAGAAFLIYRIIMHHLGDITAAVGIPTTVTALLFKSILLQIAITIGVYFSLIAVADLVYQRMNFAKEMKMEKFEVKQEYKDTEGNPEIKGKRKQIAQEIAYDEGTAQIKRAKTVVTNPHDVAVAVGYEPENYKAPWIVAMGQNKQAEMIIAAAEKYGIPIMRNIPLAHELLEDGEVNKFIPESTYDAIGEILLYLASLNPEEEI